MHVYYKELNVLLLIDVIHMIIAWNFKWDVFGQKNEVKFEINLNISLKL